MFIFVVIIHIITSLLLIVIILMQSGKGGGLTETFSGAESIFGTKTNSFMIKTTTVLAVIFLFTCIGLAILSTQRNRSLMESEMRLPKKEAGVTQQPVAVDTKNVAVNATTEANKAEKQVAPVTQKAVVPTQETQKTK